MALIEDKVFQIRLSKERKAAYSSAAAIAGVKLAVWIKAVLDTEVDSEQQIVITSPIRESKKPFVSRLKGQWEPK